LTNRFPTRRFSWLIPVQPLRNTDYDSSLSSFGTSGRQTDAENPQVNR